MAPRILFEHELNCLKENMKEMGLQVETLYDNLFQAIRKEERETIREIVEKDRIINDMEKNIEAECLSLITKQQPIARDLRTVSAALKVVTDLERAGNHVSDMGELALRFHNSDFFEYSAHLAPMVEATREQIHAALCCFLERDMPSAGRIIEGDDLIDELFNKVKMDIILFLKEEKRAADECIDILMIAKYLEKIGDHAVNIAEWECFQETGNIKNTRLL